MKLIKTLEYKISKKIEDRHFNKFSRFASYLGNGVYEIGGRLSTDTRELFLMYCADKEQIKFKSY